MSRYDHLILTDAFSRDPYPVYDILRENAPVYWCEAWGCWLLTRYTDITDTLSDYRRFSSLGRLTSAFQLPEPLMAEFQPLIRHYSTGLINVDPPDHTRMRKLLHKAFGPGTIRKLEDYVTSIVGGLLDKVESQGHMEVIGDFSYPLPVTVIAQLMGIPHSDHARLKAWSGAIVEFMATPKPGVDVLKRSQKALLELRDYFRGILEQRRREPQDDLMTLLVEAEEAGDKLTVDEIIASCVSILIGGHETTTNLISSGLLALLCNPDQLALLKANPSLAPGAVEEFLRYEGPFQRNRRLVKEDVVLEGQQIRQGELVMQLLGAANRDPAQFPDPHTLRIERTPNKHVAFGYGPHFCLGASLARLEAPIAITMILERFPDLALVDQSLEWSNAVFRGLKALHVTW